MEMIEHDEKKLQQMNKEKEKLSCLVLPDTVMLRCPRIIISSGVILC